MIVNFYFFETVLSTVLISFLCCIIYVICAIRKMKAWKSIFIGVVLFMWNIMAVQGFRFVVGLPRDDRLYRLSFYVTFIFPLLARLVKESNGLVGDCAVIPYAIIYIIGKVRCVMDGCCFGIVLMTVKGTDIVIRFPSQYFEIAMLLLILVYMVVLMRKKNVEGVCWPVFLILYSISRYIADWLRGDPEELKPFFFNVPEGRFFCIINLIMGVILVRVFFIKTYGRKPTCYELLRASVGSVPKEEVRQ